MASIHSPGTSQYKHNKGLGECGIILVSSLVIFPPGEAEDFDEDNTEEEEKREPQHEKIEDGRQAGSVGV